jgi:hypothetical protein
MKFNKVMKIKPKIVNRLKSFKKKKFREWLSTEISPGVRVKEIFNWTKINS